MERKKIVFEDLPTFLKKEYPGELEWLAFFKMWLDAKGYDYGKNDAHIVDGYGDGGIDAIAYPPHGRSDLPIIVIQSKYYKKQVPKGKLDSFFYAVEALRSDSKITFEKWINGVARESLKTKYRDLWRNKNKLEFVIVTSDYLENETIKIAKKLNVKIEDKDRIFSIYQDIAQGKSPRPESVVLKSFSPVVEVLNNESHRMYIFSAKLDDFSEAYQKEKRDLFAGNVRYALPGKTEVKKGIKKTLDKNPEEFMLFHNGITIVCKEVKSKGRFVELISPSIVNGAQTVSYLGESLHGKISDKASVLVKVVEVKLQGGFEEFETDIAMSSNTQNSVSYSDLAVIDPDLVSLEKYFRTEGCFLERKRGTISIKNPEIKINKDRLLQLFTSVEAKLGPAVTKDKQALYKNHYSDNLFKYYSTNLNRKRDALFLARLDKFILDSLKEFKAPSVQGSKKKKRRLSLSYFTIFAVVTYLIKDTKMWNEVRTAFTADGIKENQFQKTLNKDIRKIAQSVLSTAKNDSDRNETAFFKNKEKVNNTIKSLRKQYRHNLYFPKAK